MKRFMTALLLSIGVSQIGIPASRVEKAGLQYPPSRLYFSLLNGLHFQHQEGWFGLDSMYATFLPRIESRSLYPYNPDAGGKLTTVLKRADGSKVGIFTW